MATRITYDDFTRADGALGGSWQGSTTNYDILTNRCRSKSASVYALVHTVSAGAPDMHAELTIQSGSTYQTTRVAEVWVRRNLTDYAAYKARLYLSPLDYSELRLYWVTTGNADNLIATKTVPSLVSGDHILGLTVVGSVLTVWLDGQVVLEEQNVIITTGNYAGLAANGNNTIFFSLFEVYDTMRQAMSVSPPTILAGVAGQLVGVYGYGTQWTPGTPGDPEFLVSAGSIVAQTIYTGNAAGITIDAPDEDCIIRVIDPNYGRLAYLRCTYGTIQPPSTPLDWSWLTNILVARLGGIDILLQYLGYNTEEPYVYRLLTDHDLNGATFDYPGRLARIEPDVVDIRREVGDYDEDDPTLRTVAVKTLAELYALDGYPNRVTTTELLAAIGEGGGGGSAEVLEALEALSALVTEVLAETYLIQTYPPARKSLGDVLDAIALVAIDVGPLATNITSILNKVDALDGDGSTTLPAILGEAEAAHSDASAAAISASAAAISAGAAVLAVALAEGVVLAAIAAAVLEINAATAVEVAAITGEITSLGLVLGGKIDGVSGQVSDLDDKLIAIAAQLDGMEATLARIENANRRYTERDDVIIMNTYYMTTPTEVPGPMNGIFLTVTQNRSGTTYWTVGQHTNLRWSGFVAFVGDDGRMDERQPVAFTHQVYMPKTMEVAAYCVVWIPAGTEVTIEPWYFRPA